MKDIAVGSGLPPVHSMYWNNIPALIREGQASVFSSLGIPLAQECADHVPHGAWMNEVIRKHDADDVIVICDIDAFPLNFSAYEKVIHAAERGAVFGLAQFSAHKSSQEIYAGPMFFAFKKSTWEALGSPNLDRSKTHDAGEALSAAAILKGVPLELAMPNACLIPKWALADKGVFGIATFYGDCDFFHLFESRQSDYSEVYELVVSDVVSGGRLNFQRYLEAAAATGAEQAVKKRGSWIPKPLRRFIS